MGWGVQILSPRFYPLGFLDIFGFSLCEPTADYPASDHPIFLPCVIHPFQSLTDLCAPSTVVFLIRKIIPRVFDVQMSGSKSCTSLNQERGVNENWNGGEKILNPIDLEWSGPFVLNGSQGYNNEHRLSADFGKM